MTRLRFASSLAVVVGCLAAGGCSVLQLPYFFLAPFMGEPMRDPPIELLDGKKDHKKIVVLVYADSTLRFDHDHLDDEIAGSMIGQIARAEERFEVVPERKVREWKDKHPRWAEKSLQQVGEDFDVDYVYYAEIGSFSVTEEKNHYLLKGRTNVLVKIHDVNKEQTIYTRPYQKEFPPDRPVPLTNAVTEDQFRQVFLQAIARELAWDVIPHRIEDETKRSEF